MKRTIKYKLVLGLISMAVGVGTTMQAQETPAPTAPAPTTIPAPAPEASAPVVFNGKIVVVDKIARTITVDVNGKLKQLKVGPKVKMVDNGKLVAFEDLAAGQNVAVLLKEGADGSFEVVALSVEPSDAKVQAAGVKSGAKSGSGTPFITFPNPANNLGPIVSPAR